MQKDPKRLFVLVSAVIVALLAWIALHGAISTVKLAGISTTSSGTLPPDFAVHIPQKALLKNYVTVSVEAALGTKCRLIFVPPSGDTQVMHTVAANDGLCTWRWKLAESAGKGDGRLIFTINGVSDTHFIEIRSSF